MNAGDRATHLALARELVPARLPGYRGRVTGVVDWSDAALAEPARDLALILRDLGPAALRATADRLPAAGDDRRLGERAWCHARCAAREDLPCGARTGRREYATKSLDALGWRFADGESAGG